MCRWGEPRAEKSSTFSSRAVIGFRGDSSCYDYGWLAGGGSAESFKLGPVLGEFVAGRVMGTETDQELNDSFRLLEDEFEEDGRRGEEEDL